MKLGSDSQGTGNGRRWRLATVLLAAALPAHAATRYVSPAGTPTAPYDTWAKAATNIQTAVNAASSGETVLVASNVYTLSSEITVADGITVESLDGPDVTIVDAEGNSRCFSLTHSNAVLSGFTLRNGDAGTSEGGGVLCENGPTVRNCLIVSNTAEYGGGIYLYQGGTARNCTVIRNHADEDGGGIACEQAGTVQNCTIAANSAGNRGGGVDCWSFSGDGVFEFYNSIIYSNSAPAEPEHVNYSHFEGTFTYCCTVPDPNSFAVDELSGTNTVTVAPLFLDLAGDDLHLVPDSPCIDTGTNMVWMTGDVDLDRRPRVFSGTVDIGAYELPRFYAATNGGNTAPYLEWADAATAIQDAVNAAENGSTVIVSNGVYELPADLQITGGVTVVSQNGRDLTVLDGRDTVRCVQVRHTNAVLRGFTVRRGRSTQGGGAYISDGGAVMDCLFTENVAHNPSVGKGGAIFIAGAGTVTDSILENNRSANLGGAAYLDGGGGISNCAIRLNTATNGGGGVHLELGGRVCDSTIVSNLADVGGGSSFRLGGLVERCHVTANTAWTTGGGAHFENGGEAVNTVFSANHADQGGGLYCVNTGLVESCTIAGNVANDSGGGAYLEDGGAVTNSILYQNTSATGSNYVNEGSGQSYAFCCTAPLPAGVGNTESPPMFIDAAGADYRLSPRSLAMDGGTNLLWMTDGVDATMGPRIVNGQADIGAYESDRTRVYVSKTGNNVTPYRRLDDAALLIADALAVATNVDDIILVMPGHYAQTGSLNVNRQLSLVGWAGATDTTIDGAFFDHCIVLDHAAAVVDGFAIIHGQALRGGGIFIDDGGTVVNCTVEDNFAPYTLSQVAVGAGIYFSGKAGMVSNCLIQGNSAGDYGGGIALWSGSTGQVWHSTIRSNTAWRGAGIILEGAGIVGNCLITANHAKRKTDLDPAGEAGGIYLKTGGWVESCTIASNRADVIGGGVLCESGGELWNTIVYYNDAPVEANRYLKSPGWEFNYCCTQPKVTGSGLLGNIDGLPRFGNRRKEDFRLVFGSACINKGFNRTPWMPGNVDLAGQPRIAHITADIGAYEYAGDLTDSDKDGLPDSDETDRYSTDPNKADTDSDGFTDGNEVIAGTDPLDRNSFLHLTDVTEAPLDEGLIVHWASASDRYYRLWSTPSLPASGWDAVAGDIPATPDVNSYTDTNAVDVDQIFYRVELHE